ncbi:MAG: nucleotidyltransferase [Blastomonas sp.]|uniref:SMODS domain-containing nucleotidyltransferase n=1 Tax=Blastomonas sp. TaxID=1909299 RepID=UPI00258FDCA5|nr:nucleotidyltransferase [Blastomonas sp.]MCO5792829.1 nucleotidyltransferase [Blastomonas sp.]
MTVNSYLVGRASSAVLSAAEQTSINTSIGALQSRLNSYFGNGLTRHFRFGSSTRGTILPRKMDAGSDIDYMIVFSDGGYTPQTYLNRLKAFVDAYYPSSAVKQSSPSIVLELNHIKFDLVPALSNVWGGYQIPNGPNAWQATNPNDFNTSLTAKNTSNHSLIKPTIRLLKYWNAVNGSVYDSFALEKWIVEQHFFFISTQRDYLFETFDKLTVPYDVLWRKERVERAKKIIADTRALEAGGLPYSAESEIKKLIPE